MFVITAARFPKNYTMAGRSKHLPLCQALLGTASHECRLASSLAKVLGCLRRKRRGRPCCGSLGIGYFCFYKIGAQVARCRSPPRMQIFVIARTGLVRTTTYLDPTESNCSRLAAEFLAPKSQKCHCSRVCLPRTCSSPASY